MSTFSELGKILIFSGILLCLVGGFLFVGGNSPGWGRLPGDILFQRKNVQIYFPLATCLLVSLLLSLLLSLFGKK